MMAFERILFFFFNECIGYGTVYNHSVGMINLRCLADRYLECNDGLRDDLPELHLSSLSGERVEEGHKVKFISSAIYSPLRIKTLITRDFNLSNK